MADASLAITTEYVRCFLALIGKGISWPDEVLKSLREDGLHQLDVTHVITHGDVVELEKECAYGTEFAIVGETCDEVEIRVDVWLEPNDLDYRILSVTRL